MRYVFKTGSADTIVCVMHIFDKWFNYTVKAKAKNLTYDNLWKILKNLNSCTVAAVYLERIIDSLMLYTDYTDGF